MTPGIPRLIASSMIKALTCFFTCVFVCSAQTPEPVTLLFAGDVILSDYVEAMAADDPHYVFERWQPGRMCDIFVVNLEQPVTRSETRIEKQYNFKMDARYLETLRFGGVSLVHAANNHIFDYGVEGVRETMRSLDSAGIGYIGIGNNLESARSLRIVRVKGRTIGFLGYYGSGDFAATATSPGVAPRIVSYVLSDIRQARARVDYLVVSFHWGAELEPEPEPWQVRLAHRAIDAGADLIVGHHPHVLQGIELYRGKAIAYSLGNFVFGGNARHTYLTAVLKVVLEHDGGTRTVLLPVRVDRWQPTLADSAAARSVTDLVRSRSARFPQTLPFTTGAP